ncbi:hypothetical protein BC940DRAFT_84850 [Gongronella butleri]|nr:hypothetical protein BC940DRAFT_84850 [Gongronella butleri]
MAVEEDCCSICGSGRANTKNPIVFCDGTGCDLPVHKRCYALREVPDGDWYCQPCQDGLDNPSLKTTVVCCPNSGGALFRTDKKGEYAHIVCAMWHDSLHHDVQPLRIPKQLLGTVACDLCHEKKGICVQCDRPQCTNRYHVTCAIKAGYITAAASVPAQWVFECPTHQPVRRVNAAQQRRKQAQEEADAMDEDDEDDEDEDDDEDDEDVDDEDEDEDDNDADEAHADSDQEMQEDSDDSDDMGLTPRKRLKKKNSSNSSNNKKQRGQDGKSTSTNSRRGGGLQLFLADMSSEDDDDDDDDMGSSSAGNATKKKVSDAKPMDIDASPRVKKEPRAANGSSTTFLKDKPSPNASSSTNSPMVPMSQRERIEAKRMKIKSNTTPPGSPLFTKKTALLPPNATLSPSSSAPNATPAAPASAPNVPHPALALDLNKGPMSAPNTSNTSTNGNSNSNNTNGNTIVPAPSSSSSTTSSTTSSTSTALPTATANNTTPSKASMDTTGNAPAQSTNSSTTTTASNTPSVSLPSSSNGLPKQKLPNKAHLGGPKPLNGARQMPPNPPSNRKPSTSIKDLDEIQSDMNANAQRWGVDRKNSQSFNMDMGMIKNIVGEAVEMALQAKPVSANVPDPGMQQMYNRLQSSNQELGRLKDELRRMHEFKRGVVEMLDGLNVRVPGRSKVNMNNVEEYVSDIRTMLQRIGPISEDARDRVANYVQDTIKKDPSL